jgi:hypothetical protein
MLLCDIFSMMSFVVMLKFGFKMNWLMFPQFVVIVIMIFTSPQTKLNLST